MKKLFELPESTYDNEPVVDVMYAVLDYFQSVGHDLPLEKEDPSDPAFIDHLRDTLSDSKVPQEMKDTIVAWCKLGCPRPL